MTLEELNAEIDRRTKPSQATLELSHRCYRLCVDYQNDENVSDVVHHWLAGQWIATFDVLPSLAMTEVVDFQRKALSHVESIAQCMKRVNFAFWHLFEEMSAIMQENFEALYQLCEQRHALMEREGSNGTTH